MYIIDRCWYLQGGVMAEEPPDYHGKGQILKRRTNFVRTDLARFSVAFVHPLPKMEYEECCNTTAKKNWPHPLTKIHVTTTGPLIFWPVVSELQIKASQPFGPQAFFQNLSESGFTSSPYGIGPVRTGTYATSSLQIHHLLSSWYLQRFLHVCLHHTEALLGRLMPYMSSDVTYSWPAKSYLWPTHDRRTCDSELRSHVDMSPWHRLCMCVILGDNVSVFGRLPVSQYGDDVVMARLYQYSVYSIPTGQCTLWPACCQAGPW